MTSSVSRSLPARSHTEVRQSHKGSEQHRSSRSSRNEVHKEVAKRVADSSPLRNSSQADVMKKEDGEKRKITKQFVADFCKTMSSMDSSTQTKAAQNKEQQEELADRALDQIMDFEPTELAAIVYALSKTGIQLDPKTAPNVPSFVARAVNEFQHRDAAKLKSLDAKELIHTVKAFTQLKLESTRLYQHVHCRMVTERYLVRNCSIYDLLDLLHLFEKLEVNPEVYQKIKREFIYKIADATEEKMIEILSLLIEKNAHDDDLFLAVEHEFLRKDCRLMKRCSVNELASLAHLFGKQHERKKTFFAAIGDALFANEKRKLNEAKPNDIFTLVISFAKHAERGNKVLFEALCQRCIQLIESFSVQQAEELIQAFKLRGFGSDSFFECFSAFIAKK